MQIKGYMDSIDIKHVSGWAIDFEHPDEILYVKVMLGEQLLGIIPANLYRDDLLKAGIPRANCMFLFRFPRQVPASQLLQVKVIPADSGCPLAGSLTDFQSYCAGRFFPYYRGFEYTWWDIECFEEEADSFLLTGDINLPDGSSEPRFVINGYDEAYLEVGIPTRGRARSFWYVDRHDTLGYRATIPVDKTSQFNDVSLYYRDAVGRVTERPVVRFPSDKRFQSLIPPSEELTRIIGPTTFPYGSFIVGGATAVMMIQFLLKKYLGHSAARYKTVLDWGCGCGRATWALAEMLPHADIIGMDIDEQNLNHARSIIPRATFQVSGLYPPLFLKSGAVDLVYSESVFTHLSETAQNLWLAELDRILAPGGVAIITLQLEVTTLSLSFDIESIRTYFASGIEDHVRDSALTGIIADENYYRATVHTTEYVKKHWGEVFDIVGIAPGLSGGHQDAVVCMKRSPKQF